MPTKALKTTDHPHPAANSAVIEAIQGHRAESERLGSLNAFLVAFAPAIGETRADFQSEVEPPISVEAARNVAIVEAFQAVSRIARNSFVQPESEPQRERPLLERPIRNQRPQGQIVI